MMAIATNKFADSDISYDQDYTISVWDIVPGLLWAAVALGILAWWLWARDLEMGVPLVLGTAILGAGSLFLFLWAALRRIKAKNDTRQFVALDVHIRPVLTLAALVAGGVLILLAAWLCFSEKAKLQVFAEVSSLAVMGLICLGGGLALRLTTNSALSRQTLLQGLLAIRNQLGLVMTVLGLALGGLGAYFLIRFGWEYLPEGLGLVAIGLVFVGGGMWLQLTLSRPATTDTMRLLVLYTGSLTGLFIAWFTAMRVTMWWRVYFSGGMTAWQGENGWRFWLCAYIELAGLFLLFASLLLARGDIRTNVGMRRLLYGYNAFLTGLLLLAVLVVLNIIVFVKLPSNVEWTATMGMYSLSETTATTLANLKQKVTVFVVMSRGGPSFSEMHDLLDNCEGVTNNLAVEYVSPDLDVARYRSLSSTYPELKRTNPNELGVGGATGRGVLIVYGQAAEGVKPPHEFIADKDLEEVGGFDPTGGGGGTRSFKGEQVLVQTIQQLAENAKKPKVYFTQLNGELWINDLDSKVEGLDDRLLVNQFGGVGDIVTKLRKDNYEVQGLVWDGRINLNQAFPGEKVAVATESSEDKKDGKKTLEVPADCKVLVIANPSRAFSKDALEAIDRYLDRGGKVMVLTKAGILPNGRYAEDGMIDFCKKFNVDLTNDFVIKYAPDDPFAVITVKATVPPGTNNKVAREFLRNSFLLFLPRTVRPGKTPGQYQAETILQVTQQANGEAWAETGSPLEFLRKQPPAYVMELKLKDKLRDKISPDPLPVAVAVTDRESRPRAIVIGDDMLITTDYIRDPRFRDMPWQPHYYEFFRSCLEWLGERPVAVIGGIRPKERQFYKLNKDEIGGGSRLIVLPISLMALALAGIGTGIWIVRRK